MNPTVSPPIAFLLRPATTLGENLSAIRDALRALWHGHAQRRHRARALDSLGGLSDHVLRDIGAPDSIIARAVARRHASLDHRLEWPSY